MSAAAAALAWVNTSDLEKVSPAELQRMRATVQAQADLLAGQFTTTFRGREGLRLRLEREMGEGLGRLLQRAGRGAGGQLSRAQLREQLDALLYDLYHQHAVEFVVYALEDDFNVTLQDLLARVEIHTLDLETAWGQAEALLRSAYTRAFALGKVRQHAENLRQTGQEAPLPEDLDLTLLTPAEAARVEGELQEELGFLRDFWEELRVRQAEGRPFGDYVRHRAGLYAKALRSVEELGAQGVVLPGTLLYWRLSLPAEHCPDCQALAAGSPYTAETLPTVPGRGDTRCLSNCQCHLERWWRGERLPRVRKHAAGVSPLRWISFQGRHVPIAPQKARLSHYLEAVPSPVQLTYTSRMLHGGGVNVSGIGTLENGRRCFFKFPRTQDGSEAGKEVLGTVILRNLGVLTPECEIRQVEMPRAPERLRRLKAGMTRGGLALVEELLPSAYRPLSAAADWPGRTDGWFGLPPQMQRELLTTLVFDAAADHPDRHAGNIMLGPKHLLPVDNAVTFTRADTSYLQGGGPRNTFEGVPPGPAQQQRKQHFWRQAGREAERQLRYVEERHAEWAAEAERRGVAATQATAWLQQYRAGLHEVLGDVTGWLEQVEAEPLMAKAVGKIVGWRTLPGGRKIPLRASSPRGRVQVATVMEVARAQQRVVATPTAPLPPARKLAWCAPPVQKAVQRRRGGFLPCDEWEAYNEDSYTEGVGDSPGSLEAQSFAQLLEKRVTLSTRQGHVVSMLLSGRYKTVWETGESGGGGGTRVAYKVHRAAAEARYWNYQPPPEVLEETLSYARRQLGKKQLEPIANQERPVSGAYMACLPGEHALATSAYGDCTVVLRPEALARCTFTPGDSLDNAKYILDLQHAEWARQGLLDNALNSASHATFEPADVQGYVEAQVHGGVTLEDVAEIRLPSSGTAAGMEAYVRQLITEKAPWIKLSVAGRPNWYWMTDYPLLLSRDHQEKLWDSLGSEWEAAQESLDDDALSDEARQEIQEELGKLQGRIDKVARAIKLGDEELTRALGWPKGKGKHEHGTVPLG